MITLMKSIQIILFALLIIPSTYLIIREPFIKFKKYRKRRLTICGLMLLISTLVFMVLSIVITYNDDLYLTMKYAPFVECWIIIQSTLSAYVNLISFIIGCIGIFFWFILITEKRASKLEYNLVECTIPKKLTFRQKIEYPYMYYEMYINVKISKDGYFLLTDYAYKDLMEFEVKEK